MIGPLPTVIAGKKATVKIISILKESNKKSLRNLAAFGVLPGAEIKILQIVPVYVIKIGNTQLALDREVALNIIVNDEKNN